MRLSLAILIVLVGTNVSLAAAEGNRLNCTVTEGAGSLNCRPALRAPVPISADIFASGTVPVGLKVGDVVECRCIPLLGADGCKRQ